MGSLLIWWILVHSFTVIVSFSLQSDDQSHSGAYQTTDGPTERSMNLTKLSPVFPITETLKCSFHLPECPPRSGLWPLYLSTITLSKWSLHRPPSLLSNPSHQIAASLFRRSHSQRLFNFPIGDAIQSMNPESFRYVSELIGKLVDRLKTVEISGLSSRLLVSCSIVLPAFLSLPVASLCLRLSRSSLLCFWLPTVFGLHYHRVGKKPAVI